MDWHKKTIKTYDDSARAIGEYFSGIGPRVADIDLVFTLADDGKNARVVEIGCGDGRDAEEIVQLSSWYEGFDPSNGLLSIARDKLPETSFVLADALNYKYPNNIDIVFALASLLHVNKDDLRSVFEKVSKSLRSAGIFYISLKEQPIYKEEIRKDQYGERVFYYYNPKLIEDIAGELFTSIYEDHQKIGKTDWFSIALVNNR
jgi:SAM-dependent methyltransferase